MRENRTKSLFGVFASPERLFVYVYVYACIHISLHVCTWVCTYVEVSMKLMQFALCYPITHILKGLTGTCIHTTLVSASGRTCFFTLDEKWIILMFCGPTEFMFHFGGSGGGGGQALGYSIATNARLNDIKWPKNTNLLPKNIQSVGKMFTFVLITVLSFINTLNSLHVVIDNPSQWLFRFTRWEHSAKSEYFKALWKWILKCFLFYLLSQVVRIIIAFLLYLT